MIDVALIDAAPSVPLNIALIAHLKYPIAEPFAGGLEMHTHLLARFLIRRGHRVTLFAAEGSDPALGLCPSGPPTGEGHGDLLLEEQVGVAELDAYRRIMERVALGRFDIVHNAALHDLPLTMAHCLPIPMLTAFHTPPFPTLETGVRDRSGEGMRFAAVSGCVRDIWQPVVPVDAVVRNGIDLQQFAFGAVAGEHAIWSGRVVPEKGTHLAIDAARRAGIPLRVAGPLNNLSYWQSEIQPRLGGDIEYIGHLGHAELAREVARARVALCTPRWEEPYGLVVAEALACGTPVAGFARGALPEIVDAATGALAPADDVEALADAILRAGRLSRAACRRRAEQTCDATVMVAGYEAVYRGMLAPALSSAPVAGRAVMHVDRPVAAPHPALLPVAKAPRPPVAMP
ncbi:glycosyltransferase [Roseomonas haemaphysalidis]|uniref:glycosyltransferase n=1 Tax=Roseomonas haemaphysalidis TaxID=2768162 RepID=UPI00234FF1FD|nr:glycosyltransferase [Roseomonas haemaphysalidis]